MMQRCVLPGTEGFFSTGESISYLHFMLGEVETLTILVMQSWRWDESFQISASIRAVRFFWTYEGGGRIFFKVGYFNKSDIVFPVWSLDRVPKFYHLTMQCVNAQLNEKKTTTTIICWKLTIRSGISKVILYGCVLWILCSFLCLMFNFQCCRSKIKVACSRHT